MLDLSIIIVNWNTKELLNDCILSIRKWAGAVTYEVIIVDNASYDGSSIFIEEKFPDVKLIKNTVNKGFAAACNEGAKNTDGRYLFFLNPDTLLTENCLEKLVEFSDKQIWFGALGPQLIGREGRIQNSVRKFPTITGLLTKNTIIGKIIPLLGKNKLACTLSQDKASSVEQVSGAALLIKKDIWRDVGGMDERFFMFYEEVDLCRRLKDLGYNIYYIPQVQIIHKGGGARKKDRSAVLYYLQRSMFLYLKKYESGRKLFWFKMLYKPLFLLEISAGVFNRAKREFLKKWTIEFIKF